VPAYLLYCKECGFTSIAEHVHRVRR
jgi:hypothetical protein